MTDVAVKRLYVNAGDGCATFGWDYPGSTLLQVRILRSTRRPAGDADEIDAVAEGVGVEIEAGGAAAGRQVLVYQDVTGSFRDLGLENGRHYFYSVFAREERGAWHHWDDFEVTPGREAAASRDDGAPKEGERHGVLGRLFGRRADQAGRSALSLLALVVVLVATALAAAPALAADEQATPEEEAKAQAKQLALASPLVSAHAPATAATTVVLWPAAAGEAHPGATVLLTWPESAAIAIDAELPVVRRGEFDGLPARPYVVDEHHIVAEDVTGLRVVVALPQARVLEVFPFDEHADYTVREDTTPPFSWFPWFTSRPWVLLPVFGGVAVYLGIRAWLRSRAWRRRLPSMSRHDRQFVIRLLIALLMGIAIVLMAFSIWRAASYPVPDPDRLVAGDLAVWPLILFPPLLYAAALVLELTSDSHRIAWSLMALLAAASCVYLVLTMQASTTTNLTLLYYILLGCLTLVSLPRAFSPGRMGWSRLEQPRPMF